MWLGMEPGFKHSLGEKFGLNEISRNLAQDSSPLLTEFRSPVVLASAQCLKPKCLYASSDRELITYQGSPCHFWLALARRKFSLMLS